MARILVIDDDEDVRAVVLEVLASAGHEVVLASDGVHGLELQRWRPADLVITDLFMPEKEGIETIQDLKREFPDVKVIAMSGGGRSLSSVTYLSLAGALGAHAVLQKPFGSEVLLGSVESALKALLG